MSSDWLEKRAEPTLPLRSLGRRQRGGCDWSDGVTVRLIGGDEAGAMLIGHRDSGLAFDWLCE